MIRKLVFVIFYFLRFSAVPLYLAGCLFTFYLKAQPTEEWAARYERPSGSSGIANQMALDKVGNCYVLGNTAADGGLMVLIKYNSAGDTVWTRTYPLAGNVGVVADSIGNVYITGYVGPSFGPYDIITIKYNPVGIQQWIKIYNSGSSDQPTDIVFDKMGNVYISGFTTTESLIIKYLPSGDTIWIRKYTETGYRFPARTIDIDKNSNVYIGGGKVNISNNGQNYFVIKYDSSGSFKWINFHTLNSIEVLNKIKTDFNLNLYATGQSINGTILTVKYDSNGIEQWQRIYDGQGNGTDSPTDLKVDYQNNIIVTGISFGLGSGSDYLTIKYNNNGDFLWKKIYNGSGNANDESYSCELDDTGNIYITGRSINNGTSWDYTTIKYTPQGIQTWIGIYNNISANAEDIAYKILLDINKNIYVTGTSRRFTGGPSDYLTIKYSQTVGIGPIANNNPVVFRLEQNYPNPFNPMTLIMYQINKTAFVKLIIYDISGKEVSKIVNQNKMQAIMKLNLKPANFPAEFIFIN